MSQSGKRLIVALATQLPRLMLAVPQVIRYLSRQIQPVCQLSSLLPVCHWRYYNDCSDFMLQIR